MVDESCTARLDSPALLVYPQRVQLNLDLLKAGIDTMNRLRPHVKTHKCREATLISIGASITKFKCATISEAQMLGSCGASDVLLAYQPVGPKALRFIDVIEQYPESTFSCLVDNLQSANALSGAAIAAGIRISVFVDINVGMNRTGIKPGQPAIDLYSHCLLNPGLKPLGLHVYDGHIHDHDMDVRETRCKAYVAHVESLANRLMELGFEQPVIVAGGSASFPVLSKFTDFECSPGTFIYWDWGYRSSFPEQDFLFAALVMTRVVSLPDRTKLCLDAGHKAIAAENVLNKRIHFLNAPQLVVISQSEEHMVVEAGVDHTYKVGDILYGVPYHICPTVALYERAYAIEDQQVISEWMTIARDRTLDNAVDNFTC